MRMRCGPHCDGGRKVRTGKIGKGCRGWCNELRRTAGVRSGEGGACARGTSGMGEENAEREEKVRWAAACRTPG
jgi:hypothetical protein